MSNCFEQDDHIVFDIETAEDAEKIEGGLDSTDKLGIGCAVVYSYLEDSYTIYNKDNIEELRDRLLDADLITGYNSYRFDFAVIWNMKRNEWPQSSIAEKIIPKSNDLLRRIWISCSIDPDVFTEEHRGWSLGYVAKSTLNMQKSGSGIWAPAWLAEGKWSDLINYCIQDVKLTKELNDFINKYGYVIGGKPKQMLPIWAAYNEEIR